MWPDCHFTASVRTETIAPFREHRLAHRAYYLHYALLNHPVHHGRDSEFPHAAVRLWYFYTSDWPGIILPLPDLLPDTVPVLFDVIAKLFDRHVVHASCAFIGKDSFVGSVHVVSGQYPFQQF